ncbi:hypothetical protein GCM10009564_32770 [Streptomyces thermogriseus]|uniref:Uncharacterized protein n=2 Tax=Streptomyces thermogriseus TaxID=75292 RepID=A0ABP4DM61_9ACTN
MSVPPRPARTRLTAALVRQMRTEVGAGQRSVDDWAKSLGVSWNTVAAAVYGWTWRSVKEPPPLTPPPAENRNWPFARLDVVAVARMRREVRSGRASIGEMARKYGVGESTARNAILGLTWRHVTEKPAKRGDKGGRSAVPAKALPDLAQRKAQGDSYRKIADDTGFTTSAVFRALQRYANNLQSGPSHSSSEVTDSGTAPHEVSRSPA